MSDRVSIRYQNGTSVEANNLGDAIVHLAHTDLSYVVDVVEEPDPPGPCKHCDGTGLAKAAEPKRLLTRKQAEDRVAQVNEEAPVAGSSFEDRVKAARNLA
jgi:hypothetical protein